MGCASCCKTVRANANNCDSLWQANNSYSKSGPSNCNHWRTNISMLGKGSSTIDRNN
ncbi:hypothetical protein D9M71_632820 [compost metagenome]